ncbi:MAG: hypothetical protein ABS81_07375 [Pseudonocardia sp. SCN 72-86]|nr:MAG: hypothetical protein ABS81_07375 [Pseudonocardia sp. SCN 72-86]
MARTLDELDLLAAAVQRDGATTSGSTGQVVEHPALAGMRAHRQVFDKLLVRLALPDRDGELPATAYQQRARAGNTARWGNRGSA